MSEPQENRRGTLLEWVKDSGLLTVTILGLLIYALFAIPTGVFYFFLGASLAEVGITYTSLLSGSVLGLMLIVGALVYVLTFSYCMYFMYRSARSIIMPAKAVKKDVSAARNKYPRRKDWRLDDEDFDERLRWLKARYSRTPVRDDSLRLGWEEFESNLRRRRELRKKANLTSDESFELQSIE